MTEKQKAHIRYLFLQLMTSKHSHLWDVYESYSDAKARGYEYCQNECERLDGWNLRIIRHNGWFFTVAYLYYDIDKETGEILRTMMNVHTAYEVKTYDVTEFEHEWQAKNDN